MVTDVTRNKKKKTIVASYQLQVREFMRPVCLGDPLVPPQLSHLLRLIVFYHSILFIDRLTLADNYIPARPPPLSDLSIIPLLSTRPSNSFPNYVYSLPPEVIQEILVLGLRATRTPRSRVKYLKAISSVPKFWRSPASAEVHLWSIASIVLGNAVGTLRGVVLRGVEVSERNVVPGSDEAELKRAAMWLRMSRNAPLRSEEHTSELQSPA